MHPTDGAARSGYGAVALALAWSLIGPATATAAALAGPPSIEVVPATPRPSEVFELVGSFESSCGAVETSVEVVGRRVSLVAVESCPCSAPLSEPQPMTVRGAAGPLAPGIARAELVRAGEAGAPPCGAPEVVATADFVVDASGEVGRIGIEPVPLTSSIPITLTLRSVCPVHTSAEPPVLQGTLLRWVERYNPFIGAPCFDRLQDVAEFQVGPLPPGEYHLDLYTVETDLFGEGAVPAEPSLTTRFTVLSPTPLVLHDRFEVLAVWSDAVGGRHQATPVKLTAESGVFWFFDAGNIELLVKVLDGCTVNGRSWVFAAGLTGLDVEVTVRDSIGGITRTYTNTPGAPFRPVLDLAAFPAACPAAALLP